MPEPQEDLNKNATTLLNSVWKMKKVYGKGVNDLSARGRRRKIKRFYKEGD